MKARQRGFTLVEVMMVVAILGILTAVALPSYQAYLYRAKAAEVVLVLDKLHTALSGLQAEQGKLNEQVCLYSSGATGAVTEIAYHTKASGAKHGSVPGISPSDLTLTHLGLRVYGASCVTSTQLAGQYQVVLLPDRASHHEAQQIALAVRQVMQARAYKTSASSSGTVSLYFQL